MEQHRGTRSNSLQRKHEYEPEFRLRQFLLDRGMQSRPVWAGARLQHWNARSSAHVWQLRILMQKQAAWPPCARRRTLHPLVFGTFWLYAAAAGHAHRALSRLQFRGRRIATARRSDIALGSAHFNPDCKPVQASRSSPTLALEDSSRLSAGTRLGRRESWSWSRRHANWPTDTAS